MLLGEKAVLSTEQQNAFMRSGTFHIFSISGLHVGVIALALQSLLRLVRVPRRPAVVVGLCCCCGSTCRSPGAELAGRTLVRRDRLSARRAGFSGCREDGSGGARGGRPGHATVRSPAAFQHGLPDVLRRRGRAGGDGRAAGGEMARRLAALCPPAEAQLAPVSPRPQLESGRWLLGLQRGVLVIARFRLSGIVIFHVFFRVPWSRTSSLFPVSSLALIAGFLSLLTGLAGLLSLSVLFNFIAALIILHHGLARAARHRPAGFLLQRPVHPQLDGAGGAGPMTAVMLAGLAGGWARRYGGYWPPALLLPSFWPFP